jgi:hypothetical protein
MIERAPITGTWNRIKAHREWLLPVIFILVMLLAIRGCYWLTGREPDNDPRVLVEFGYKAIALAFVLAVVGFCKSHGKFFADIQPQNWQEAAVTRLSTLLFIFGLLWFFSTHG